MSYICRVSVTVELSEMAVRFVMYVLLILDLNAIIIVNCDVQLSDSCRQFSTEIFNMTAFTGDKRRIVISPYSIWSVMFSVALGANGTSAKEVRKVLRLPDESGYILAKSYRNLNEQVLNMDTGPADNISMIYRNYMFFGSDFEVNPLFIAITSLGMGTESKTLSFNDTDNAVKFANEFVASSGFKSEIMLYDYLFRKSRMVLNSQGSFKGVWKVLFDNKNTAIEPFHNEDGKIINDVYMMRQRSRFAFAHIKEIDAFILELPYASDGNYCMLIVLPKPGKFVKEVYKKLIEFSLVNVLDTLENDTRNYGLENIEVRIPRFEIDTYLKASLDMSLEKMGISEISNSKSADFSTITTASIFFATVDHRARIHVTESGTVASATTSAVLVDMPDQRLFASGTDGVVPAKKSPIYSPGFIANKPFIYLVVEKNTKSIMYGGVYAELVVYK